MNICRNRNPSDRRRARAQPQPIEVLPTFDVDQSPELINIEEFEQMIQNNRNTVEESRITLHEVNEQPERNAYEDGDLQPVHLFKFFCL